MADISVKNVLLTSYRKPDNTGLKNLDSICWHKKSRGRHFLAQVQWYQSQQICDSFGLNFRVVKGQGQIEPSYKCLT